MWKLSFPRDGTAITQAANSSSGKSSTLFDSTNERMIRNVTKHEIVAGNCQMGAACGTEVMELLLLLPNHQFLNLEEAARGLSLTVGQLIRRTVSDFLLRSNSTES
jgi:hypothetical protein